MALCVAFKTGGSTWKQKLHACVLTSVNAVFVTGEFKNTSSLRGAISCIFNPQWDVAVYY